MLSVITYTLCHLKPALIRRRVNPIGGARRACNEYLKNMHHAENPWNDIRPHMYHMTTMNVTHVIMGVLDWVQENPDGSNNLFHKLVDPVWYKVLIKKLNSSKVIHYKVSPIK
jgi:hypothetical protein